MIDLLRRQALVLATFATLLVSRPVPKGPGNSGLLDLDTEEKAEVKTSRAT